jgi:hypothetical protein
MKANKNVFVPVPVLVEIPYLIILDPTAISYNCKWLDIYGHILYLPI